MINLIPKKIRDTVASMQKHIEWYFTLVAYFFQKKLKSTVLLMSLSILLQILLLASFLLPIKMLFFLGSHTFEPVTILYLNNYVIESKQELAYVFIALFFLMTIIYFILEHVFNYQRNKSSLEIWKSTNKLQIYSKQEKISSNLYNIFIDGVSGLSLFLIILGFMFLTYDLLAIVFFVSLIIIFNIVIILYSSNIEIQDAFESKFQKSINFVSQISFFILFVTIVLDITYSISKTDVVLAIISFILLRRAQMSFTDFLVSIKSMYKQQDKILKIFFTKGIVYSEPTHANKIWKLFDKKYIYEWTSDILFDLSGKFHEVEVVNWLDADIKNEFVFIVKTQIKEQYLFKVFDKSMKIKAIQEKFLLENLSQPKIFPDFLGQSIVDGFACHVFFIDKIKIIENKLEFIDKKVEFLNILLNTELPQRLIKRYTTTHKLLHERFPKYIFNQLRLIATKNELDIVDDFENNFDDICKEIKLMPLNIFFNNISSDNTVISGSKLKLLKLSDWKIEPIGFALKFDTYEYNMLQNNFENSLKYKIELVMHLRACEDYIKKNMFTSAIKSMQDILILIKNSSLNLQKG